MGNDLMQILNHIDVGTILTLLLGGGVLYGRLVRVETRLDSIKTEIKEVKTQCRSGVCIAAIESMKGGRRHYDPQEKD